MAFGLLSMKTINRVASNWLPVLLLFVAYRLCSYTFGESYAVQTFGAAISVLFLYCCGLHLDTDSWLGRQMVTFGKYSLFSYLAQIAVLRAVVKLSGGKPNHWVGVLVVAAVTTALLFLSVQAIHALRQRSRVVDATYRTVFA
jgi:hypothetical protein